MLKGRRLRAAIANAPILVSLGVAPSQRWRGNHRPCLSVTFGDMSVIFRP
jgi:hypothetical protein